MSDPYINERLDRIEAAIGELKSDREQLEAVRRKLAEASKKFVESPNLESAKVFLNELDRSSDVTPTARSAAWTTITVTVTTVLDDDQGD